MLFQFTLPRGERCKVTTPCETDCSISIHAPTRGATISQAPNGNIYIFQSTLPQGERQTITSATEVVQNISIHAPTRGATYCFYDTARLLYISIHAPTRGATNTDWKMLFTLPFQSTLPQGERPTVKTIVHISLVISIHAPTRGATPQPCCHRRPLSNFNPRSHKGSDWYPKHGIK